MESNYIDLKSALRAHSEIKKTTHTKNILKYGVWIIAGCIAIGAGIWVETPFASVPLALVCLGTLCLAIGIWMALRHGSHWVYGAAKTPLQLGEFSAEKNQINAFRRAVEQEDFSGLDTSKNNAGGGVKLEYAVATDGSYGIMQLFIYEGYTFVPASEVIELTGAKAEGLKQLSMH